MPTPEEEEIEADEFAMEFLMPEALLRESIKALKGMEATKAVRQLAKAYAMSPELMTFRLVKLGIITTASQIAG